MGRSINVKADISNYATRADFKNVTHLDTSTFALKRNLASSKNKVHKIDIDKLVLVPVDLNKLSDVVKNGVVKKTAYHKLVSKVKTIDTSGFVLKTKYQSDKAELEKKISDVNDLVKETKLTELENEISDISGLATKSALITVGKKMPDPSSLVKKKDYDTKINELEEKLTDHNHDKYITTPQFNTVAARVFNARLAQANLITKIDFIAKLSSLNGKINSNKTKHLVVKNGLEKLKTFDSSFLLAKVIFKKILHKFI